MPGYVRFKPFGFVDGARLVFADTLHKHLLSARLLTFSMLRAWEAVFRWLVRRCAPFSAGDPTLRVPAGDELCWPVGSSTGSDAVAIVKTSNPLHCCVRARVPWSGKLHVDCAQGTGQVEIRQP